MLPEPFFSPTGGMLSPEYNRFAAGWYTARSTGIHWYWSGKRQQWENYDPAHYVVSEAGLEILSEGPLASTWEVFPQLQQSWDRVRQGQPDAIWNPRDGAWLVWRSVSQAAPPPPTPPGPLPAPPDWEKRMDEELAAADKTPVSPAEHEQLRQMILKRYFE